MRGPDLVGYAPDSLRWSTDSQKLYFDWRKPGEDEASTYVVARDGGSPTRLTVEQRKTIPPATGRWDKARRRVLFADRGDIVLIDASGARKWITRTMAPYPVENHSFERASSWADEYKRILELFEDNLRQGATAKNRRALSPVQ